VKNASQPFWECVWATVNPPPTNGLDKKKAPTSKLEHPSTFSITLHTYGKSEVWHIWTDVGDKVFHSFSCDICFCEFLSYDVYRKGLQKFCTARWVLKKIQNCRDYDDNQLCQVPPKRK
jgi:hypothetical protein